MVIKCFENLIFCCALICFIADLQAAPMKLRIGAAASLQDVLQEAGEAWLKTTEKGTKLTYNFAGTSTLVRQIKWGAPLDVFISASKENADEMIQAKLGLEDSVLSLASNRLVLISPMETKTEALSLEQLAKLERVKLATCDEAVPVGFYTHSYLRKVGFYERL